MFAVYFDRSPLGTRKLEVFVRSQVLGYLVSFAGVRIDIDPRAMERVVRLHSLSKLV